MSQIRDKKAHRKHIATMNPINAKSVQLIELHAFAYCLLSVSLSESFDFLKVSILNVISVLAIILLTSTTVHIRTSLCTTLCTTLCVHFSTCSLEGSIDFCHSSIDSSQVLCFVSIFQLLQSSFNRSFLISRQLIT